MIRVRATCQQCSTVDVDSSATSVLISFDMQCTASLICPECNGGIEVVLPEHNVMRLLGSDAKFLLNTSTTDHYEEQLRQELETYSIEELLNRGTNPQL